MKKISLENLQFASRYMPALLATALVSGWAQAQTCSPNTAFTAPDSRYSAINNGAEVKDNVTRLIWQRCSIGQRWNGKTCLGIAVGHTWANAHDAASTMNPSPSPRGKENSVDSDNSSASNSASDSSASLITAPTFVASSITVAWRLPTHKELFGLIEQACRNPAINTVWFPATRSSFYWSVSVFSDDTNFAWGVDFSDGRGSYDIKGGSYGVRLVRFDQ